MPDKDHIPMVVIACKVFEHLLEMHLPQDDRLESITFLDYGLHQIPKNLKEKIQETIDEIQESSLIVLGYGLCGNGLDGISAGKHILLVPRTDDCIAILLGSYQEYQHQFQSIPATYYLTKGWLETASNPLSQYREYEAKYGAETATYVMDQQFQHYKRLVFVAHNQEDLDNYRPQVEEIAQYCARWGMRYEEILGSDNYIRHLVEAALALGNADDQFIVIPPGGELKQSQFLHY
jgi:hypothetical protein